MRGDLLQLVKIEQKEDKFPTWDLDCKKMFKFQFDLETVERRATPWIPLKFPFIIIFIFIVCRRDSNPRNIPPPTPSTILGQYTILFTEMDTQMTVPPNTNCVFKHDSDFCCHFTAIQLSSPCDKRRVCHWCQDRHLWGIPSLPLSLQGKQEPTLYMFQNRTYKSLNMTRISCKQKTNNNNNNCKNRIKNNLFEQSFTWAIRIGNRGWTYHLTIPQISLYTATPSPVQQRK